MYPLRIHSCASPRVRARARRISARSRRSFFSRSDGGRDVTGILVGGIVEQEQFGRLFEGADSYSGNAAIVGPRRSVWVGRDTEKSFDQPAYRVGMGDNDNPTLRLTEAREKGISHARRARVEHLFAFGRRRPPGLRAGEFRPDLDEWESPVDLRQGKPIEAAELFRMFVREELAGIREELGRHLSRGVNGGGGHQGAEQRTDQHPAGAVWPEAFPLQPQGGGFR